MSFSPDAAAPQVPPPASPVGPPVGGVGGRLEEQELCYRSSLQPKHKTKSQTGSSPSPHLQGKHCWRHNGYDASSDRVITHTRVRMYYTDGSCRCGGRPRLSLLGPPRAQEALLLAVPRLTTPAPGWPRPQEHLRFTPAAGTVWPWVSITSCVAPGGTAGPGSLCGAF